MLDRDFGERGETKPRNALRLCALQAAGLLGG